jgi:pseudouridine synthase
MPSERELQEGVRLQKALATAGVASRRVCENLIVAGKVKVNGKVVTELGSRVDPRTDSVTVSGRPIQLDTEKVYLALNKPEGVVSTMADEHGRPDLSQYGSGYDRVFNVGRLDAETTGLILLTNDGDMAHVLAHPSFGVEKTYVAKIEGEVPRADLDILLSGVELEDGRARADRVKLIAVSKGNSLVELVIHSGKNRIVRRMFDAIGYPVIGLVRKQFGPIHLGALKLGQMRELTKIEVGELMKIAQKPSENPKRKR